MRLSGVGVPEQEGVEVLEGSFAELTLGWWRQERDPTKGG